MALVGNVTAMLDGIELNATDFNLGVKGIRKSVPTFKKNSTVKMTPTRTGSMSVLIDKVDPEPDWEEIENSVFTFWPKDGGGVQTTLVGFAVTDFSESYTVDNEAKRDIEYSFESKSTK